MQKATAAAVSKSIDLTPILPSYKTCTISLQDGKPNLYADNGVVQLNRELSNAEINKIQQTLGSTMIASPLLLTLPWSRCRCHKTIRTIWRSNKADRSLYS